MNPFKNSIRKLITSSYKYHIFMEELLKWRFGEKNGPVLQCSQHDGGTWALRFVPVQSAVAHMMWGFWKTCCVL